MTELLTELHVFARLRKACADAGSQAEWARRHGLSQAYVSAVLNSAQPPGTRILNALGLARVDRFVEVRRVNG